MTFSGRIRLLLVSVAILPPLLTLLVAYFESERREGQSVRREATDQLHRLLTVDTVLHRQVAASVSAMAGSRDIHRAWTDAQSRNAARPKLDPRPYALDFAELLDGDGRIMATYHRPGLLDQHLSIGNQGDTSMAARATLEYDLDGPHIAYSALAPVADGFLFAGRYVDARYREYVAPLLDVNIWPNISTDTAVIFDQMTPGQLYEGDDGFRAVIAGTHDGRAHLIADFLPPGDPTVLVSMIGVTGVVAALSVLMAIGLGFYITGRAKREIDNLVAATSRVASGDFTTPVMAYEEGEFSQLADSFTDMISRLRELQRRLATSERIAAWESLGRRIAHEVKNPLMPIAVSADDLRRSYREGLPDFERTLKETTETIKVEVNRLSRLLDEFAGFARMRPPDRQSVAFAQIESEITGMYPGEVRQGRIVINNVSRRGQFYLDPEQMKQVFINLLKNSLEEGDAVHVAVIFRDDGADALITLEDDGPGFPPEKLDNSFEPYVTTKEGGSGLGLVICHRIVHDHGGRMELYNRPEGGAGIRITLPQQET